MLTPDVNTRKFIQLLTEETDQKSMFTSRDGNHILKNPGVVS
jgi:hypothetical protein